MKFFHRHRGAVALALIVSIATVSMLLLAGFWIALSVTTGIGSGAFTVWITRDLRDKPNDYISVSESD